MSAAAGDPHAALVVCPTPIGHLADITLRALDELRGADAVACEDTRHTGRLLAHHGIKAPLVSLHEHNEQARAAELIERIGAGQRIVLTSDAGMPAVSDPGARLIAEVASAGLVVTVLPGASAVTTGLVASGLAGGGFVFAGFLPRTKAHLNTLLDRLDPTGLPIVAFESPKRLPASLRVLAARAPTRPAAVCRELSKLHEQIARGTLEELVETFAVSPRGEITLVLGAVSSSVPGEVDPAALAELAAAVGARRAADLGSRLSGVPRNALYRALTTSAASPRRQSPHT